MAEGVTKSAGLACVGGAVYSSEAHLAVHVVHTKWCRALGNHGIHMSQLLPLSPFLIPCVGHSADSCFHAPVGQGKLVVLHSNFTVVPQLLTDSFLPWLSLELVLASGMHD